MMILTYKLRPSVLAAIRAAVAEAEKREEVAILVRSANDRAQLEPHVSSASVLVLDLQQIQPTEVVARLPQYLSTHPYVRVVVVPMLVTRPEDQRALFTLGRLGVSRMPTPEEAEHAQWWLEFLGDVTGYDNLQRAMRSLYEVLPAGPRGITIGRCAQHATVPSVKSLAIKIYSTGHHSVVYKRRKLWEECKAAGLSSPEDVHTGNRLFMIKVLLDQDSWTLARIARHFGYPSPRHLARSIKVRTGMSLAALRRMSRDEVLQIVQATFWTASALVGG